MSVQFWTGLAVNPRTQSIERCATFARNTSGRKGALYELTVYPDGSEAHSVNSVLVNEFRELPSTRELRAVAWALHPKVMELLASDAESARARELHRYISDRLRQATESR